MYPGNQFYRLFDGQIPFILYGANVNNSNGNKIQEYVRNLDTAATALYSLGITPPQCWISNPVGLSTQIRVAKSNANNYIAPIVLVVCISKLLFLTYLS